MWHNLFIHSSIEVYLGCFQVLAIINKTAINIFVQDSGFLDYMVRVCLVFQENSSKTAVPLHPHQQWMKVPVALHAHQHLMLSVFQILDRCGASFHMVTCHLYIFGKVSEKKV